MASEETHLKYGGTDVLCKNIAFYLNNFLWNKASKNIVSSDQHIQQNIDENNANFPTSLGYSGTLIRIMLTSQPPWDTVERLDTLRLKNIEKLVLDHLNINSLPNNFDQLKVIIKKKIDILAITETISIILPCWNQTGF